MDQHLTVRDASKLIGKSESTIKRLIREVTADADHADRSFILPAHDEVVRRRAEGEPYVWKIDRVLLLRRHSKEGQLPHEGASAANPEIGKASQESIIEVLREQLQSKDQQIRTLETQLDRKDRQIDNLNERMRESNILMQEVQKKLAIAPPTVAEKNSSTVLEVDSPPEEGTQPNRSNTRVNERPDSIWTRPIRVFGHKKLPST